MVITAHFTEDLILQAGAFRSTTCTILISYRRESGGSFFCRTVQPLCVTRTSTVSSSDWLSKNLMRCRWFHLALMASTHTLQARVSPSATTYATGVSCRFSRKSATFCSFPASDQVTSMNEYGRGILPILKVEETG